MDRRPVALMARFLVALSASALVASRLSLLSCLLVLVPTIEARADLLEWDLAASSDGLLTRDTTQSLDWLDLPETSSLSYDDVETGAGGWTALGFRHATTDEVCSLFAEGAFAPSPCPGSLSSTQSGDLTSGLMQLLGITSQWPVGQQSMGCFDDEIAAVPDRWGIAGLDVVSSPALSSSSSVVPDLSPCEASASVGHFLVRPFTPDDSIAGGWVLDHRCDFGAGPERAGTTSAVFTHDTSTGEAGVGPGGPACGSAAIAGAVHRLSSCSILLPDPSGLVTGTELQIPPSSESTTYVWDATFESPFTIPGLGTCGTTPVARYAAELRYVGQITLDDGRPIRIDAQETLVGITFYDAADLPCYAGPAPGSCTSVALCNDVPAGSLVSARPLEDVRVDFLAVGTAGRIMATRLTESAGEIPGNFRLADGFYYDIVTDASGITTPIYVCLSYPDADQDGIVDGTSPPLSEHSLQIAHDEGGTGTFIALTTELSAEANTACAYVDSLSEFVVVGPVPVIPGLRGVAWLVLGVMLILTGVLWARMALPSHGLGRDGGHSNS